MTKRLSINITKIIFSIFIIFVTLWQYRTKWEWWFEFTFISSIVMSCVILIDGIINIANKRLFVPSIIYELLMPCMFANFCTIIAAIFIDWVNFKWPYIFLHIVNPLFAMATYIFTTKVKIKSKFDYWLRILLSPIALLIYGLFDVIRFIYTGFYMYGLMPKSWPVSLTMLLGTAIIMVLGILITWGLLQVNLTINKMLNMKNQKQK